MTRRGLMLLAGLALVPAVVWASPKGAAAPNALAPRSLQKVVGFSVGASGGMGGEGSLTLAHFAHELPLAARFAVGYRASDAGVPLDARHVFINNNDNGTPEENGRRWDFRFDAMWHTRRLGGMMLSGGPRYSRFTANFKFVGGNEFFDVTTNQWGLGLGAEKQFPFNARTHLLIGAGLDYYANATFQGHDTAYSPDGSAVNPHEDYTYADANAAIAQPHWSPRLVVGFGYRIGN